MESELSNKFEMTAELSNQFEITYLIQKGTFSSVYKAFYKTNKKSCVLKIISKDHIKENLLFEYPKEKIDGILPKWLNDNIFNEIKIMCCCKSKNIVELYESFETEKYIVLVLELCDFNLQNFPKKIDIILIQKLFLDLNDALKILYERHIMHRNIKPENIYLKYENNDIIIPKLGDFGASTFYNEDQKISDHIGTLLYMAPEILNDEMYDYKCDLYSLGVVLYQLIFSQPPFYSYNEEGLLLHMKTKFILKTTGIASLDNLLKGLLEISPENRLSMKEYLNHPFFKEDLKNIKQENEKKIEENKIDENENKIEDKKIEGKQILKQKKNIIEIKSLNNPEIEEIGEKENINLLNKISTIVKNNNLFDIMQIPNGYVKNKNNKDIKISNILYYDENIGKHSNDIHTDSDYFERITSGAFILCSNIVSLKLVMEEIKDTNLKQYNTVLFNLIVTGSKFQKVMDFLIENQYEKFFQNICIYCLDFEKYSNLSIKYNKIKGIYNSPEQVMKFIEDTESDKIKEFSTTKILSYFDYTDKYYERHEKIAEFYGDLTKETYNEYYQKMKNYINSKDEKDFKIDKNILLVSFETFDISKDLENLEVIIMEYTKDTFYRDLNNWLRIFKNNKSDIYEIIAYYTARLMYSLNNYALKSNCFYKEKKVLYRGTKTTYTNLIAFERLKGKIILFSSFTSTSENIKCAKIFSNRDNSESIYKAKKYFSVIYKIKNYINNNCIPCGVNIQKVSIYDEEKEILIQPFSFYLIKKVKFNYKKYTVDIDLELIQRQEVLEEEIKKGKNVIYDKKTNLMIIDEKGKK